MERVDLLDVLRRVVGPGPYVAGLVEDEVVEHRLPDVEVRGGDRPGGVQRLDVGPRADTDHTVRVRADEARYGKGGRAHHRGALEEIAAGRMESVHVSLLLSSRSLGGKCALVQRKASARMSTAAGMLQAAARGSGRVLSQRLPKSKLCWDGGRPSVR